MKFNKLVREYFTFSRNERIGIAFLVGLIILVGIANRLVFYFETPGEVDREEYLALLQAQQFKEQEMRQLPQKRGMLFSFDPNRIDSLGLDSLLLPARVKMNLLGYRRKGGRFSQASDLKKIYGMNDSIFEQVLPFIRLEPVALIHKRANESANVETNFSPKVDSSNVKMQALLDLNQATETDLVAYRGIGEKLSARIIKYRNLLGGYSQLSQLSEVYGLPQETINHMSATLTVDTLSIQKINVNFADKKELAKHPYLSWGNAQAIIDFRSKNGPIDQISRLKEEKVLPDSVFVRIKPYLKTNE